MKEKQWARLYKLNGYNQWSYATMVEWVTEHRRRRGLDERPAEASLRVHFESGGEVEAGRYLLVPCRKVYVASELEVTVPEPDPTPPFTIRRVVS